MGILLLVLSLWALWRTRTALRRPNPRGWGPLWVSALVAGELAIHNILLQAGLVGLLWWGGALGTLPGKIGLGVFAVSWAGLVVAHLRSYSAGRTVRVAVERSLGVDVDGPIARVSPWDLLRIRPRLPRGVELDSDLPYGPDRRHVLDLYRPKDRREPLPVVVQIHGGSWMRGRKERHALQLIHELASNGWAVAAISYRLSPAATFPAHIEDVKRAVAWLRDNAEELDLDPSFVATTGGSAGGHLAALTALTPNHPEYERDIPGADTSIQACVPFYGIYRLIDRTGTRGRWPFLDRHVMKSTPLTDPGAWAEASPIRHDHSEAPPFLVIHGSHDSLVRVGESRRFAEALREESASPVAYAEIFGATHGFDYFASVRATQVAREVRHFLERVRARTTESAP